MEHFTLEEDPRPKVRVQPGGFVLYERYKDIAQRIYNLKFRPGDIVLITTPKSGTHWALEMIWNISHDVDIETARKVNYWHRSVMLEYQMNDWDIFTMLKKRRDAGEKLMDIENELCDYDPLDKFETLESPRVCFTHLPFNMLPPNMIEVCKIVFVTRNPADLICSYHPYMMARNGLDVSFDTFFQLYLDGNVLFSPYWTAVKQAWERKDHPNLCFLMYEDMKKDLRGVMNKVATHLGKLLTEEQTEILLDHLSFDSMRKNPAINMAPLQGSAFMAPNTTICRKGQVGGFKNVLSQKQKKQLEEWIAKNRGDCEIRFEEMQL